MWQRYWAPRRTEFLLLGVAHDVLGAETGRPAAQAWGVTFPMLLDRESLLGRLLGFRIVPSGFFVDAGAVLRYRRNSDFDMPTRGNVRTWNGSWRGRRSSLDDEARMAPAALELFAEGVGQFGHGHRDEALLTWRRALQIDPDNFLIRSQIWAVEHPEHFYPVLDRNWQEEQLLREGYDKPLP